MVECLAKEDTVFIEIVARSNHCADYTFIATINNSPMGLDDVEPNNDIPNAGAVPNMPGDIEGRVRYGLDPQDALDYFALGKMEDGDSLNLLIEAFKNPISVEISHSTGFPTINYNNVQVQQSHDLTITNPGLYYMKVTSAFKMCTDYKVIIDGRISNRRIDGVDLLSAANASRNLDISNSTAGPNQSIICGKCIRFCPVFVVPVGVEMTVNIKP